MASKIDLFALDDETYGNNPEVDHENVSADELPPTYSSLFRSGRESHVTMSSFRDSINSCAMFEDTGRFSIDLNAGNRTSAIMQAISAPAGRPTMIDVETSQVVEPPVNSISEHVTFVESNGINLDLVLMLVGSRDEIKSIISIGQELSKYGHRIRVATHSIFQSLVKGAGLEFFSISSSPDHPIAKGDSGLMPDLRSPSKTRVMETRKALIDSLKECWNACIQPGSQTDKAFLADAIIATPLAFAHIHCAERLSIPLHLMSTIPWSPTKQFAHPLAIVKANEEHDPLMQDYLSYLAIEDLLWNDAYEAIDHFRQAILGLSELPLTEGGSLLRQLNIPHTYLWSPAFLPKPDDWNEHTDITGYIMSESTTSYTPSKDLLQFLDVAIAPVLVSLEITQLKNPEGFFQCLQGASEKFGIYFLIPSGLQSDNCSSIPSKMFVYDDMPTEWIIPRVAMLLTDAHIPTMRTGILNGKPIITMPFLRDQPFWATAVNNAGLGPKPMSEAQLSTETLCEAFRYCLQAEVRQTAQKLAQTVEHENGAVNAALSFHSHLKWEKTPCGPTGGDQTIYRMRLKPSIDLWTTAKSVLMKKRVVQEDQREMFKYQAPTSEDNLKTPSQKRADRPSFDAKAVSKSLIRAIVKPTVSHIADAFDTRQVQNDEAVSTTKALQEVEKSRSDVALKLAKNVAFVSTVACGKIAILPFKTVWYMSETASYGMRAFKGSDRTESKPHHVNEEADHNSRSTPNLNEVRTSISSLSLDRDDPYVRGFSASRLSASNSQKEDKSK